MAGRGRLSAAFWILIIEVGVFNLEMVKFSGKLSVGHLLIWEDPTMVMFMVSRVMV